MKMQTRRSAVLNPSKNEETDASVSSFFTGDALRQGWSVGISSGITGNTSALGCSVYV